MLVPSALIVLFSAHFTLAMNSTEAPEAFYNSTNSTAATDNQNVNAFDLIAEANEKGGKSKHY